MTTDSIEEQTTTAVRDMVLGSPRLTRMGGGEAEVRRILDDIDDVWLDWRGTRVHCDLHRAADAKATVVFQPGSGSHARNYFLMGGLLAQRGFHVLAIDRPGHGLSDGDKGDCTVEEAVEVAGIAIDHARRELGVPVVLMGSSMGGLLTVFGLQLGLRPELAVAHNFVYPGKLFSMRMRARWIARRRTKPYPLTELVHGFEKLSDDPSIAAYLKKRDDPGAAWELSPRSVASMFGFNATTPPGTPRLLVISGDRDNAIPAWATRFFAWLAGVRPYDVEIIKGARHLLFHDHLDESIPVIATWINNHLRL